MFFLACPSATCWALDPNCSVLIVSERLLASGLVITNKHACRRHTRRPNCFSHSSHYQRPIYRIPGSYLTQMWSRSYGRYFISISAVERFQAAKLLTSVPFLQKEVCERSVPRTPMTDPWLQRRQERDAECVEGSGEGYPPPQPTTGSAEGVRRKLPQRSPGQISSRNVIL